MLYILDLMHWSPAREVPSTSSGKDKAGGADFPSSQGYWVAEWGGAMFVPQTFYTLLQDDWILQASYLLSSSSATHSPVTLHPHQIGGKVLSADVGGGRWVGRVCGPLLHTKSSQEIRSKVISREWEWTCMEREGTRRAGRVPFAADRETKGSRKK